MTGLLTIGDFARATHLSVKALRHYDDVGLLEPAEVDPSTGYRRYRAAQVPAAHLIRRLRELDMPLPEIGQVLAAADDAARDAVIGQHLQRMELALQSTSRVVAALRALLERRDAVEGIGTRTIAATPAVAVREVVAWADAEPWLTDARARLHVEAGSGAAGPDAALYSPAFFEHHLGEVTAFVPVSAAGPGTVEVPGGTYAVAVHRGSFDRLDETYGRLGAHVTANGTSVPDEPVREHYLGSEVTEVLWPVRSSPGEPLTLTPM